MTQKKRIAVLDQLRTMQRPTGSDIYPKYLPFIHDRYLDLQASFPTLKNIACLTSLKP
jgi:hypothetical protein